MIEKLFSLRCSSFKKKMKKVKVIVERSSDNKYCAYKDSYDLDFGLDMAKKAIELNIKK